MKPGGVYHISAVFEGGIPSNSMLVLLYMTNFPRRGLFFVDIPKGDFIPVSQ